MLIPVIYVKDRDGIKHLVGTNSHDVLFVDKDSGGIQYFNLQSSSGTSLEYPGLNGEYSFEGEPHEYAPHLLIHTN